MAENNTTNGFPETYIRLRTVLDGLQMTALRYCLNEKDASKRIANAEEIEKELMPIINRFQDNIRQNLAAMSPKETNMAAAFGGDCPEGYNSCNGCCVPYDCP